MINLFKFVILVISLSFTHVASAQRDKSGNYNGLIKKHNLSKLWQADSLQIRAAGDKIKFPEPLGYIGEDYQRFYIHYLSVSKDRNNPNKYNVYGKTKVKDNICSFTGTITVKNAMLSTKRNPGRFQRGSLVSEVAFYEEGTKPLSGVIKGTLTTNFYLDEKGKPKYDALNFSSDGYKNNQCVATWTSYSTGKRKKCNWGDFRMPDSNFLDNGAGEVSINKKYANNGWVTFTTAYSASGDDAEKALKSEQSKWWCQN